MADVSVLAAEEVEASGWLQNGFRVYGLGFRASGVRLATDWGSGLLWG